MKHPASSFVTQLTLRFSLSFLLLLVLLGVISYSSLQRLLLYNLDRGLEVIARSEADFAQQGPALHLHPTAHAQSNFPHAAAWNRYVQIFDIRGQILASNTPQLPAPLPVQFSLFTHLNTPHFETVSYQGHPHRQLYLPFRARGQPYVLVALVPLEAYQHTLRQILVLFLTLGLVMLILSSLLGWLLARQSLKPLTEIIATAQRIGVQQLSARIPCSAKAPRELADLTAVLNEMFTRLQQSVERMQQFSADAAHELKTPLTVLKGEIQVALRRERTLEYYQALLQSNLEEVNRLIALTESLLALSRIERDTVESGWTELHSQFQQLQARYAPILKAADVTLHWLKSETPLWVAMAPIYFEQVLSNLIDNALRFSKPGQCITVRTAQINGQVQVWVCDQGPGIATEEQEKIFDRFYQVGSARTENRSHFGIGLSLCRAIMEAHQGHIRVHSQPGQGTCFELHFAQADTHLQA